LTIVKSEELLATVVEVGCSVDVTDVDDEFWRNGDDIVALNTVMFILSSCISVGRIAVSSISSKDKSCSEPFSADTAA
jgi:hypothetical protein